MSRYLAGFFWGFHQLFPLLGGVYVVVDFILFDYLCRFDEQSDYVVSLRLIPLNSRLFVYQTSGGGSVDLSKLSLSVPTRSSYVL